MMARDRVEEWAIIGAPRGLVGDQGTYWRVGGHDRRIWKEYIGRNGRTGMRSIRGGRELARAG
jgi:hypothetical protein